MPRKEFESFTRLDASDVNTYLMDQSVMTFAGTAARGSAISTPVEGMVTYLEDSNSFEYWDSAEWDSLVPPSPSGNFIINGAMQVAQRGTSTANITTNGYYTADRFAIALTTLGTWTQSVEADAPTGSGFRNSVKMLCTTADASPAAGDILNFQQRIEGQNLQQFLKGTASAKPFALSFWVKSNVTGTYIANLTDVDNTRTVSASYTISASATWEKKTIIFPADTTGAFDNDNLNSMTMQFGLGAGTDNTSGTLQTTWAATVTANRFVGQTNVAAATSNYWQVTGVQLELGNVASDFDFQDIQSELAACQRYCQVLGVSGVGMWFSTTTCQITWPLLVEMRVNPSVTLTTTTPSVSDAGVANRVGSGSSFSIDTSSTTGIKGNINGFSSATNGRVAQVQQAKIIRVEAEL
jgi:hypothetical protein